MDYVDTGDWRRTAVLVVGEDDELRMTVATFFRDAGFSVLDALDTKQARHMVGLGIIDVIICDFDVPGGAGLELLEWLRAGGKNIPLFFMTSGSLVLAKELADRGAVALFRKPSVGGHAMVATVKNYLVVETSL